MRHNTLVCTVTLLVLTFAASANAQDKRGNFILGGGYTAPFGEVRDSLGDGWHISIGGQANITPIISIEGLYSFNGLGEKNLRLPVSPTPGGSTVPTDFFANMNMQSGTGSLVFQAPEGTTVRPYGLVGAGIYYRPVQITKPGVGYLPGYCDPYWYVCYPGGFVPVENIVGERSSTDFGMVFGGGANFGVVFAEVRYHYIWGPEIESQTIGDTTTEARKADGKFLQVSFGVRF
jgi:hypothetical protein